MAGQERVVAKSDSMREERLSARPDRLQIRVVVFFFFFFARFVRAFVIPRGSLSQRFFSLTAFLMAVTQNSVSPQIPPTI